MTRAEKEKIIETTNTRLQVIGEINSFCNDGKTYYIALLDKIENDPTLTLRKHFEVKNWTFDLKEMNRNYQEILKQELLGYFGQYLLQAKMPYIKDLYEGKKGEEFAAINEKIILHHDTNCEYILDDFIDTVGQLVGDRYTFYRLQVNWHFTDERYEWFYECYENDYLFDLGDQFLFLHFGGSD
jgi:hypothetical protein